MMKNKSTLAKLLAEEDIFVVHKQMETAYFNSKSRELGLPIWKDEEMTKDIYDLMVCHEIGHALGLSHTSNYVDIMYFFGFGGDIPGFFARYRDQLRSRSDIATVTGLSEGDLRRLAELYAFE